MNSALSMMEGRFCVKFCIYPLTSISSSDIIYISQADITVAERIDHMGINTPALTEAVYYILLSLMQPMHGYGIMQNVEQLSGGRLRLAAGTLYGAISSMLDKGWITALDGAADSRKKEYLITEAGRDILRAEYARLKELVSNGRAALEMEAEDA